LQNALVFKAFLWRRTARPGVKNDLDGASNSPPPSQSLMPSLYETLNLADEAVFTAPRNRPETHPWFDRVDQNQGIDHVSPIAQRDLRPVSRCCPSGHGDPGSDAMAEIVEALFAFFSISIFLAHAVDAFRAR
jgi:hypothetical protein